MKRRTRLLAAVIGGVMTIGACSFVGVVQAKASRHRRLATPVVWMPPANLPAPSPPPAAPKKPGTKARPPRHEALLPPSIYSGRADGGRVIHNLRIAQRAVFLTIDDGNTRDPRVLDLIRKTHLPVSSFLIQNAVDAGVDYWKAMARAGVKVENHTRTHARLTTLGIAGQEAQICTPEPRFAGLFGSRPALFRPPYGAWNASTVKAAAACGVGTIVLWDVTYGDGWLETYGGRGLQPGDIVLLHYKPELYDDLLRMMRMLRAANLGVGSLEDYLRPIARPPTTSASPKPKPDPSGSPSPSKSPAPIPTATPSVSPAPSPRFSRR